MTRPWSRTTAGSDQSEHTANGIPPQRYYTVLSAEAPGPFGFGSAAPARPDPRFADTPGPGKYEPRSGDFHTESIRGRGLGFTSNVPRRLGFTRGTKNPAPCSYEPAGADRRVKVRIGTLPKGQRCLAYPDERETSLTPGPGSYDLPPLADLVSTSVFKSRSERKAFPEKPKPKLRFDGRTFVLKRSEL